jgi:hypothetical protein
MAMAKPSAVVRCRPGIVKALSAAVRWRSIAVITGSWLRLT